MYERTGLFRVTCDYTIKAKNIKEALNYVIKENENHVKVEQIQIPIDIDLTQK